MNDMTKAYFNKGFMDKMAALGAEEAVTFNQMLDDPDTAPHVRNDILEAMHLRDPSSTMAKERAAFAARPPISDEEAVTLAQVAEQNQRTRDATFATNKGTGKGKGNALATLLASIRGGAGKAVNYAKSKPMQAGSIAALLAAGGIAAGGYAASRKNKKDDKKNKKTKKASYGNQVDYIRSLRVR